MALSTSETLLLLDVFLESMEKKKPTIFDATYGPILTFQTMMQQWCALCCILQDKFWQLEVSLE